MSAEASSTKDPAEAAESEVAKKVRRLREQIQVKVERTAPPLPEMWLPPLEGLRENQRAAEQLAAAVGVVNPRPAGLRNRFIQKGKQLLSRSLDWQIRPQRAFNRHVSEALTGIADVLDHTGRALHQMRHQLALQRWSAEGELMRQGDSLQQLEQRLLSLRQQMASLPATAAPIARQSGLEAPHAARQGRPLLLDYFHLERQFRGTEDQIRERQRFYLPLFRACRNVLDIACGRGEFLELMREAKVEARGVDLDAAMVERCRQKGLHAEQADVFDFLEELPDGSLDGIFSSQFVEHLQPEDYTALIGRCASKLAAGGVLAIETQNPECLAIFSQSFFIDPTHVKPIPPAQLRFIFAEQGLERLTTHFLSPAGNVLALVPQLSSERIEAESLRSFNAAVARFNETFFGGMDYSVVGYRRGSRAAG